MDRAAIDAWLGHRPKDRRGLPIPWINHWGEPGVEDAELRHDGWVGMPAVFVRETGDTVDFTRQNMQRQRESMMRGLCQVCARQIPWSRRNVVVADLSVRTIEYRGQRIPAIIEPWLDDRCAEIATKLCPALIRRRRDEHLTVVPVRSKRDVVELVSTGWLEGPLEAQTKAQPPAMWVKLGLLSHRIVQVEREVAPA